MYFIFENYAQYLLTPIDVNSQNTAISLKPINFIDTTKLILYPKVRNSMSQLTIISGISKIAFPFFPAQTTSNYSQMYLTKTTNKRRPRLSNYLPCVWVWLPQLSGGLGIGCRVFQKEFWGQFFYSVTYVL